MVEIINKTRNGKIFKCQKCNNFHIEYKNLNFNLTYTQFENFCNYILSLDAEEWEYKNRFTEYTRKIIVPIGHKNFNILFNINELNELKLLLSSNILSKDIMQVFNEIKINDIKFINCLN